MPITGHSPTGKRARKADRDYHALAASRGMQWLGPMVAGVRVKTLWRCAQGHEWPSRYNDIDQGYGCPVCAGRVVTGVNSLAAVHPDIAAHWHPTLNGDLRPQAVQRSSHKVVWWLCPACGSEWSMSVNMRDNGQGCPYCAGRRVNATNSLAARQPEVATQWHEARNAPLTPDQVAWCSGRSVWWRCQFGHEWRAKVAARVSQGGRGCPQCSNQSSKAELRLLAELRTVVGNVRHRAKVSGREVDLFLPDLGVGIEIDGAHWHGHKGDADAAKARAIRRAGVSLLRLREEPLPLESRHDVRLPLRFDVDPLPTLIELAARLAREAIGPTRQALLDYVAGHRLVAERIYRRLLVERPAPPAGSSLLSSHPDLAVEWDIERNTPLMPHQVTKGSHLVAWWHCPRGHPSYQASVLARTGSGNGCPYCAGKRICGDNSLAAVRPDVARQWHPSRNGALTPATVAPFSSKRVWWQCSQGHEWQAPIAGRSNGHGCPNCSRVGRRKRVGPTTSLAGVHPQLVAEWHPTRNSLQASQVSPGSRSKAWWKCVEGHEWNAAINNRSHGAGCPICHRERRASSALVRKHPGRPSHRT